MTNAWYKIFWKLREKWVYLRFLALGRFQRKIFCIGRNKTGTTSLMVAMRELGYKLGHQPTAELLIHEYAAKNWKPITDYCKTAQAFQDAPFSWPNTWRELAKAYPNAKFILTCREDEKWYSSITNAHSKLFADGKRIPTKQDLQNAKYRYKGYFWEMIRAVYATPEDDPYNKEMFIYNYKTHNAAVKEYFAGNPNFLAIDVSESDSYQRLCTFLNKKPIGVAFPHMNKTADS